MTLPGWNNFEAVKTAHHALGLAAIIFFILMVIFECIAHFGSSGKTLWNTLGIAFLALAIVCEAFAYPYSLRNEKLADGKIEGQQQIIGGLSNQLARVESQYDQATNALAVATNTVAAFESKAKPRMITPELKEKFIGLVRDAPKGKIVVQVNEGAGEEPRQFAKQINEMILAAGYESGNRSEKGGISTVWRNFDCIRRWRHSAWCSDWRVGRHKPSTIRSADTNRITITRPWRGWFSDPK
jgi:hypothetical protein